MTRDAKDRLADISEALGSTQDHVGGSLAEPHVETPLVLHAVLFNLVVIGEAAKSIDSELRSSLSRGAVGGLRWLAGHHRPPVLPNPETNH